MKNKKQKILLLAIWGLVGFGSVQETIAQNKLPEWAFGGFVRPKGVNPLIEPTQKTTFDCPMQDTLVKWECADTFNPAAAVKEGKICILYRAEDNPNVGIGKRTSRIGLVESKDGVSVTS